MRNILVIRSGAIGDLVVTLPALRALRGHYPDARLEMMGYPATLELLRGRYYADAVSSIDQAGMARFYVPDAELPEPLARYFGGFDLILAYVRDPDGVLYRNLRRTDARQVLSFDPFPQPDQRIPMVRYVCEALKPLGIQVQDWSPKLYPSASDRAFAEAFWKDHHLDNSPDQWPDQWIVALHPGSGSAEKVWPTEHFVQLARWMIHTCNAKILLVSGPADKIPVEIMLSALQEEPVLLLDQVPLPQLAAILERCDLFLGNDSGITHMAAATGTTTIAIFGPTDPKAWGPTGEAVHILRMPPWNNEPQKASCTELH